MPTWGHFACRFRTYEHFGSLRGNVHGPYILDRRHAPLVPAAVDPRWSCAPGTRSSNGDPFTSFAPAAWRLPPSKVR